MGNVLALRFDVDSITCIERGIPRLRRLADTLGVRFTFFVNMGHSFNAKLYLLHALSKRSGAVDAPTRRALPVTKKLGLGPTLRTVVANPRLGDRYRVTFDQLAEDGHELGLHGGMDHAVWQRSLHHLDAAALERLYRPAYDRFAERYGAPAGFASPGFVHNESVLRLIDADGYEYASDMTGDEPFRPTGDDGAPFQHYQVPVNVIGQGRVPIIEQGLATGDSPGSIVQQAVDTIRPLPYAHMYGHPYVEGVHAPLLEEILGRVRDTHEVVTVGEYLARWRTDRDG